MSGRQCWAGRDTGMGPESRVDPAEGLSQRVIARWKWSPAPPGDLLPGAVLGACPMSCQ